MIMAGNFSLINSSSVVGSLRRFDDSSIFEVHQADSGFPASNLFDPQPRVKWRFSSNTDAHISILVSNSSYDVVSLLFASVADVLQAIQTDDTWRVRATENVDGTGAQFYDSGLMPLWVNLPDLHDLKTFKDPTFYPGGVHVHHVIPGGVNNTPGGLPINGLRIDFDVGDTIFNIEYFEIGRIAVYQALRPILPGPGEIPTPIGSPAKSRVKMDMVMPEEDFDALVFGLASDRGSSPRTIKTWGHDIIPLDGAGTVVICTDIDAADPWRRHQRTIYGVVKDISNATVQAGIAKATLTVEGL